MNDSHGRSYSGFTGYRWLCTALIGMSWFPLQSVRAEPPPPKTVVDFYTRLPEKYFEDPSGSVKEHVKEHLSWAHLPKSVIDIKDGYMSVVGDGAQQSITVCLFKRADKSYVIAVGDNDHEVFDPYLDFYSYENGKWRNITRTILPVRVNSHWDYVLPRYGRTIHVLNQAHHKVYDLEWKNGAFHVVKS